MHHAVRVTRFPLRAAFLAIPTAGLGALLGCSSALVSTSATSSTLAVTGNWQLTAAPSSRIPGLSGELSGAGGSITGRLHATDATSCLSMDQVITIVGSANKDGAVTLSGTVAGGILTVSGTLAADGKSLSDAAYQISGGSCAFPKAALSTAQAYSPITGNYAGTFSDASGPVLTIAASLSQTPAADNGGNFQLSGTATFPANSCFNSPVSVSNSQVTGGSFTLTYTDASTANVVTALGSFSPDGTTLTVTTWTLTGVCGPDSGTGNLVRR